jgi:threonine dehydratase
VTLEPVGRAAVEAAAAGLGSLVRRTPVVSLEPAALDLAGSTPLVLKLELVQRSGSFKARGATWQLLAAGDAARERGVAAASGGNFGIAVAEAAAILGVGATVFVTSLTAPAKVARLRGARAAVVVVEGAYADALAAATEHSQATGAVPLHAYDDPAMIAGNGTMALELEEQAPAVDTVLVAVGGGGLIAGVLAAYAGRVRVVAVETTGTSALAAALAAGEPADVDVSGLCADSLGARRLGDLNWAAVQAWRPISVVVDDAAVEGAQHRLWAACRIAAEPGGAAALAALTSGAYRPAPDERVAAVVCGANMDPATLTLGFRT